MISYDDANGKAHPSFRGSTHVLDESRLGGWIRNRSGGLPTFIADGAPVEVVYRNPRSQAYYRLNGYAWIADDPETCDLVYHGSPPHEQAADPLRKGVAMVIEVRRIAGRDPSGDVVVELEVAG